MDAHLAEWGIPHEMAIAPGAAHSDADIYERLGAGAFRFYQGVFGK
jgi:hypothetical protein